MLPTLFGSLIPSLPPPASSLVTFIITSVELISVENPDHANFPFKLT